MTPDSCSITSLSEDPEAVSASLKRREQRRATYFFPILCMFDPMSELSSPAGGDDPLAPTSNFSSGSSAGGFSGSAPAPRRSGPGGGGASRYGEELHSITIRARQRTFYVDLKQSANGKFFKISEKSRGGQKSTIVFDVEDLPAILGALQEMQGKL